MKNKTKSLFISHGGGPLPLLGDPAHQEMVLSLKNIAAKIVKPDAIVVVSAHWEERIPTITAGQNPSLIYDYSGFPAESYQIQYPCEGHPDLAADIYHLLSEAGIESKLDQSRGFDHGLFVPLTIMYPEADIPCVQLSLVNNMDAAQHIEIGRALQALSEQNVLVIGSGFSFHNMSAFFAENTTESSRLNHQFEQWLQDVCCNRDYQEQERTEMLVHWVKAEGARYCHPREEHLLPLHVCYGVAQSSSYERIEINVLNKEVSMYLW